MAEKVAQDAAFLESFDMKSGWLPPNTRPDDYTLRSSARSWNGSTGVTVGWVNPRGMGLTCKVSPLSSPAVIGN
jgi:hypothetical protein